MAKSSPEPTIKQVLSEVRSVKSMVMHQGKAIKGNSERISKIEDDLRLEAVAKKAGEEAVEKYKSSEDAKRSDPLINNTWLTKELLRAILALIGVIAAMVAVLKLGATVK